MQDNNSTRRRRSDTFRRDGLAEQDKSESRVPAGSGDSTPLRPPSSAPRPGDAYRYAQAYPNDRPAPQSSYSEPAFTRQEQSIYMGDIDAEGKKHNERSSAAGPGRSAAYRTNKPRRGKTVKKESPRKPGIVLIIALAALFAGIAVLVICLTGSCDSHAPHETRAYVKGEKETGRDKVNAYNMGYSSLIQKYCTEYDVPPAYVAAIIKNESSYDSDAENSRTHAKGLMQLMTATAQDVAARLKIENFNSEMLKNPDINIRMGTYYIHWISANYFKDDYTLITCAYHAGQGNVKSWLKKYSSDGKTLTVDQIPTSDTRSYAGKVMNDYAVYYNHIYNFRLETQIRACAARFSNLSGALVAAVIKTGSLYDPDAVYYDRWETKTFKGKEFTGSSTEEYPRYGLMQLTREMMLRHIPEETADDAMLLDVGNNLKYGCMELSDSLTIYDGDLDTALCAYRTSDEQTKKWISALGNGKTTLTVDDIPDEYAYVREYIKEVKETYEAYKPFYED